jgi:pSer/pThr/pTyr-binding forkhead associated (FHA) protein
MSSETEYLDFELTVEKIGQNEYLVRAESGDGEARATFTSPFNDDQRALIEATLTKVALRSTAKVRSSSAPEVKRMKDVGSTLFEQAVSGPVREFYYKCQGQADQQGKGIRWRLALDPSLGSLPWEFLYFKSDFLALDPRSPIVRYIRVDAQVAPLKEEHPLRLLVVIASPSDEVPLDTTAEKERINAAVQKLTEQGLVEVTYIEGPDTWSRLCDELLYNRTHILHFIGHGTFDEANSEGLLVMEDADGKADPIDSERLRVLMKGKSRLRLVVLNSCLGTEGDASQPFSSTAAGLVSSGIPAVIAMQFEISDNAALEIARTFYTSLALNFPVDRAVTEARRKIYFSNRDSLEWATPVLYMQVPDGQLFQFQPRVTGQLPKIPVTPLPEPETDQAIAVLVESGSGREIPLGDKTIKIGRGADNDIDVDEAAVSRKHATLTRSGSTYAVENFGSSGTLLNGEPIARRTDLKHNDVIRVGTADFKFRLAAESAAEVTGRVDPNVVRARRSETVTVPPEERESFEDKAARSYESGVQFMARGNWPEAIAAFNSARTYVPGYKDVEEKLSVCESRFKVASMYAQARHLCAQKNYDQALQALAEATRLDPGLVDSENLREVSECGQKYLQAIAELQKGNRAGGGTLLREIIRRRPNFEDAEKRFDNLAKGGTGLIAPPPSATVDLFNKGKQYGKEVWADWFGAKPAPPPGALVPSGGTSGVPEPSRASGYAWRTYEIDNPNVKQMVDEIEQYFISHRYDHQPIPQEGVWIVQGRKAGGWRDLVGMGQTATVVIEPLGNGLKVSIGGAKWFDKGAGMATGFFTGGVTWVTSVVGIVQQQQLVDDIWLTVERFIKANGGRQLAFG